MEGVVGERESYTLVVRKPCFGLPTACLSSLPLYLYLRFANVPFQLDFNLVFPDSDQIPYIESGDYVAYNNEKGGVIERLKRDVLIDLDTELDSVPEWISTKALLSSWLADAVTYELWVGSDSSSAETIYFSDLPWPIGKVLFLKQKHTVKQQLGISKDNAEQKEEEIYRRAGTAYEALSTRLGDQDFLFENRPSSLDAIFLGQALIVLQALPEMSVLRQKLLEHGNLVRYVERVKAEFVETGPSYSVPHFQAESSSSNPKKGPSKSSKPKSKPKKEKTNEEKTFKRRAKYFLATQLVAVLLFLTLMGRPDDVEVELDEDDEGYIHD
ncbi:mitochondrial outer membrane import complex protein METAXIN [Humulus lupulus]|uniref:mitochondrial outer membrane import complex protein METAXIN n=1 Tax=Humulus lupulus TaxID=3486 RepID=UPI002B40EF0B|nr:mitochondrial outer membrane import complex protein METAXIN [Humulus lupulus]